MKQFGNSIKKVISLATVAGIMLTQNACKKEEETKNTTIDTSFKCTTTKTINNESYCVIADNITANATLKADTKYLLSGGVFVKEGATLTIEAGTQIFAANDASTPFLAIERGAKIDAQGTAAKPIVMTTIKTVTGGATRGDWGGLILNGKAPINTGTEAMGEGNTGLYGGTLANDNSGIVKYLRIEYGGKQLGPDNELNGLTIAGVGSATTLEYIQVYKGSDDGFEFFGGSASLKYALSTGNGDDSFDYTHGWNGVGENWIVKQDKDAGDRGLEADNNGDDNSKTPFSNPTITKFTINGNGTSDGMKLREGTKGTFSNIVIDGFEDGVEVQHDVTLDNVVAGSLTVSGVSFSNISKNEFKFNGTQAKADAALNSGKVVKAGTSTGAETAWTAGWTK